MVERGGGGWPGHREAAERDLEAELEPLELGRMRRWVRGADAGSSEEAAAARRGEEHDASDVERGDLCVTPLPRQACCLHHRARCLRSQRLLHHRVTAAQHIDALLEGNELPPSSRAS